MVFLPKTAQFDFAEKKLDEIPVVVLDTETTGLYVGEGHRSTEIGAVRLEGGKRVAQMGQLLNPQRPISPQSSKVSGIAQSDVVSAPTFAEIEPDFLQLIDGALLVAHKAVFDAGFIGLECALTAGSPPLTQQIPLPNPWLCTLKLAQKHFHFGYNNLGSLARQFGVRMGKAHRALNDALATAEVLRHLAHKMAQDHKFRTVGDLLFAQGEPIYAAPLPYVKLPPLIEQGLREQRPLRVLYAARQQQERWLTITPRYAHQHKHVPYLIAFDHDVKMDVALQLYFVLSAELTI